MPPQPCRNNFCCLITIASWCCWSASIGTKHEKQRTKRNASTTQTHANKKTTNARQTQTQHIKQNTISTDTIINGAKNQTHTQRNTTTRTTNTTHNKHAHAVSVKHDLCPALLQVALQLPTDNKKRIKNSQRITETSLTLNWFEGISISGIGWGYYITEKRTYQNQSAATLICSKK